MWQTIQVCHHLIGLEPRLPCMVWGRNNPKVTNISSLFTLADPLRRVAVSLDISTMATLRFTRSAYTFTNPRLLITASTYRAGMQGQQSLFSQLRGFRYRGGTSGAFSSFILCKSIKTLAVTCLTSSTHVGILALSHAHQLPNIFLL